MHTGKFTTNVDKHYIFQINNNMRKVKTEEYNLFCNQSNELLPFKKMLVYEPIIIREKDKLCVAITLSGITSVLVGSSI
jgi:hypothetical protein